MAQKNQNWDDLGQNIQDIIDRAVNQQDYEKLNQTIRQVVDRAVDLGTDAVRKAAAKKPPISYWQREIVVEPKKELPVLYANTGSKSTGGILKLVFGGIAEVASLGMLAAADLLGSVPFLSPFAAVPGVLGGAAFLGGMWLIGSGVHTLGMIKRFKIYRRTLGDKTYCTLEKLARSVGKSVKFVRKELGKMIDAGLFLQGHMDKEQTRLITSDETYHQFEQSRLQLEERQRLEAAEQARRAASGTSQQVQEVLDKGDAFVAQIRKCNDAIPGVEISEKISRMELIVQRIFDRAETNPEIVPDLKKLMDYYLPMTVKLLTAYADMDAQPVQGDTIVNAKREIEGTLDTLNLAFEKLLDELFMDTAMDVSSDITVLQTLLAQEGLTEDGLTQKK